MIIPQPVSVHVRVSVGKKLIKENKAMNFRNHEGDTGEYWKE